MQPGFIPRAHPPSRHFRNASCAFCTAVVWLGLLAGSLRAAEITAPLFNVARQVNFVQSGSATITPHSGSFYIYFECTDSIPLTTFTGEVTANGALHRFQFVAGGNSPAGMATQKSFGSIAELDANFAALERAKIVVRWSGGQSESLHLIPSVTTPQPPVHDFDALQDWPGGPVTISWQRPMAASMGWAYIDRPYVPVRANIAVYRVPHPHFADVTPMIRVNLSNETQWTFNDLRAEPGETLFGELAVHSGYNVGWIRFPIRRRPAASTPVITTQPKPQTARVGDSVTFAVEATGLDLKYQWHKGSAALAGATRASLELKSVQVSDAGTYSVVVSNTAGQRASDPADLTVLSAPVITTPPASQTVLAGSSVTFVVVTQGSAPLTYQWFRDGATLSGATGASLTLDPARFTDAGSYTVTVSNAAGRITSEAATLAIEPVSRISNLSIRSQAGGPAGALAVGITIGGAGVHGGKPLLVRAVGPTLGIFGVSGALADPRVVLQSSSAIAAQNDDWAGNEEVARASEQVGAFTLAGPASKDAAFAQTIPAASYTVQITGAGNSAGVVLAEVYDTTVSETFGVTTPRLTNVSALTHVGTADGVLIAGFSIAGTTPKKVLIRGIGPTLGSFGMGNTLADPKLELFVAGRSTALASSDDWSLASNADEVTVATTRVGAFALATSSRDAALLVTLPPGAYTAQVSGVNNTTGTALVEFYDVP